MRRAEATELVSELPSTRRSALLKLRGADASFIIVVRIRTLETVPLILNLVTEGEISCPLLHIARCRLACWPPLNLSRQFVGLSPIVSNKTSR